MEQVLSHGVSASRVWRGVCFIEYGPDTKHVRYIYIYDVSHIDIGTTFRVSVLSQYKI